MSDSGWQVRISSSKGIPYYYHPANASSMWDVPSDLTEEQKDELRAETKELERAAAAKDDKVRASHLLVKHSRSRRPSSWKEENISRSKEDAVDILKEYETEISGDTSKFAELASKHSDCSSHEKGGDLGWFKRGQMQKPFEDATYALEVGQMSDIISTDSGVHIILRTG